MLVPGVSLVGWILILVALNEISDVVQDRSIFDDALLAGITAIIGGVVTVVGFILAIGATTFGRIGFWYIWGIIAIFWIFAIISSIFLKQAYDKTAKRLNVPSFATAGLLYLIGAITAIVFIGLLIIFIALIFQIIAYFSIEDRPPAAPYPGAPTPQQAYPTSPAPGQQLASPQTAQPPIESKFCIKCGAKIPNFAEFCTSCGAKQS